VGIHNATFCLKVVSRYKFHFVEVDWVHFRRDSPHIPRTNVHLPQVIYLRNMTESVVYVEAANASDKGGYATFGIRPRLKIA